MVVSERPASLPIYRSFHLTALSHHRSTRMSTSGEYGGSNLTGEQLDVIALLQETKADTERLLRLLEEEGGEPSRAVIDRALGADSHVRSLVQSVQAASLNLGRRLHDLRYGSISEDMHSTATQSTTRDHEAQLEEGEAGSARESQPRREAVPEPAGVIEVVDPFRDNQNIERGMPARSLISDSGSRQAETGLGEPPTTAIQPVSVVAAEGPGHCTICFDEITTLCILQPCNHRFDLDCLMPWLVSVYRESHDESTLRCPLCRQVIDAIRHSITDDGYSTMRVVGPYFRQQFPRHHFRRPREDPLRPFSVIAVHHFDDDLGERFPGNGTVASYFPHGPLTDELRRRQRAELRLNARRADAQPDFVREDHVLDEVFESMGTQDILDMIARRERLNGARQRELEAMGEGASMDLHIELRRPSIIERQVIGSPANGDAFRLVGTSSNLLPTISDLRNLVSSLTRQYLHIDSPLSRRLRAGDRDGIIVLEESLISVIQAAVEEVMRREHDERW